ncbi:MAG: hypothetical protein CBE17_01890 [Gammaproteobacteria bacterium TMED257]|nr:MAG: hypothetical protein CBE17_01890 [Gammaproteobacteria bacterium TMED257]|tara:strand:- start:2293 stop:3645 length:1353 start_codon:yes stop_codon:yes gene_type:complete
MLERNKNLFVIILFAVIGIIGIYNILHYDSIEGYDAEAHYNYIDHFSRYLPYEINLPDRDNSREFFNPPLGYLVPSVAQVICRNIINSKTLLEDCRPIYGTLAQITQLILYMLTIFINIKILNLFFDNKKEIKFEYLILASLMAINYKTIIQIRGEPYILLFLSCLLYIFLRAEKRAFEVNNLSVVGFGLCIGLLALSRQWAFLLFPAFFILIFFVNAIQRLAYIKFIFKSFFLGFLISSWYYFSLLFRFGSFTAFNKEPIGFSFSNQPINFYIPNLSDIYLLFTKPIRPNFSNQFVSILYSDFWGDYWGYFSFTSRKLEEGRNQLLIGDYLARVNIVSLLVTLFLIYCFFNFRKQYPKMIFTRYINLSIIISFIGYLWFLISYPDLPTGDTNKATYMVQIFNLLLIPASIKLVNLRESRNIMYNPIVYYLIFTFFHNFSSYLSHFPFRF